jgi:D-sedoheptulose 7-phosphate isomerase
MSNFYREYFQIMNDCLIKVDHNLLIKSVDLIIESNKKGKKIIVVGNGGSAAMASHVAVDFTKAAGIRAVTFNEADLLTCFGNDYGYENWVEKALGFYADPGDTAILISSSGTSPNILKGTAKAREMGLSTITLSGFKNDNPLRELGDINLWADSQAYNVVEMTHHIWLVGMVDYIINLK